MDKTESWNPRHRKLNHEVQEGVRLYEAGGSLDTFVGCPKETDNPGHHQQFISVDNFNEQSLGILAPEIESERSAMFKYVKNWLPSVVRIHGHYISERRPDNYLFSDWKGKRCNTVGTGWVGDVRELDKSEDQRYKQHLEQCEVCKTSGKKEKVWCIFVMTARHVIFDQNEASKCEVVFFDHHDDGRDSVTQSGLYCVFANTEGDLSRVYFHTHDAILVGMLKAARVGRFDLRNEGHERSGGCDDLGIAPVVVLSHPHGRKLYITCGNDCGNDCRNDCRNEGRRKEYDAKTCSGSSGGPVIHLNKIGKLENTISWMYTFSINHHSGTGDRGLGVSSDFTGLIDYDKALG